MILVDLFILSIVVLSIEELSNCSLEDVVR